MQSGGAPDQPTDLSVSVSADSLQCSLAALQGTVTAPVSFTTLCAPPDQPRPPTLQNKTKTSLHVRYAVAALS